MLTKKDPPNCAVCYLIGNFFGCADGIGNQPMRDGDYDNSKSQHGHWPRESLPQASQSQNGLNTGFDAPDDGNVREIRCEWQKHINISAGLLKRRA
jgi:hypothetical protein